MLLCLDQIRKMDWIPRTIRQKQKKIESVIKEIEQNTGRAASDEEIARGLPISKTPEEPQKAKPALRESYNFAHMI